MQNIILYKKLIISGIKIAKNKRIVEGAYTIASYTTVEYEGGGVFVEETFDDPRTVLWS